MTSERQVPMIYLFTCSLFKNAVSNLYYKTQLRILRRLLNDELESIRKRVALV
jgi:hypothetical protein